MYNNKLLVRLCEERNIKDNTIRGYITSLKSYTTYCNMSLEQLLSEAILDEQKLLLKNRHIKKHLIDYRSFLIKKGVATSTIKNYMSKIKTFYKHYEIEIPELPPVKYKKEYVVNYKDLPSKKDIRKVLDIVPLDFKALILFMSSSGTAKAETLSLTVKDFFDATSDYHNTKSINGFLSELSLKDTVIPTFYVKRRKTDKYYFTFCSSEASSAIVQYLKTRDRLSFEDKLFPFTDSLVIKKFEQINDYMGWGFKGHYRFFRSHSLRKFHASNIGLSTEIIDELQGRSKNNIHETYIKTDPKKLKEKYLKNMHNILIYPFEKEIENNSEDIIININIFLGDSHLNIL